MKKIETPTLFPRTNCKTLLVGEMGFITVESPFNEISSVLWFSFLKQILQKKGQEYLLMFVTANKYEYIIWSFSILDYF